MEDPASTFGEDSHTLLHFLARYKFLLAIENAECPDYVTEKLWKALKLGTVPIYLGAPNIQVKNYN